MLLSGADGLYEALWREMSISLVADHAGVSQRLLDVVEGRAAVHQRRGEGMAQITDAYGRTLPPS